MCATLVQLKCNLYLNYATYYATKLVQNACNICNALIHRGEILEKIVRKWCDETGKSLKFIADAIGYHRNIVYRHFGDPKLSYSIIFKYGKTIDYDFSIDFPEMSKEIFQIDKIRGNEDITYTSNEACLKEVEHWRNKYIALLEQYNTIIVDKLLLGK